MALPLTEEGVQKLDYAEGAANDTIGAADTDVNNATEEKNHSET